MGEGSREIEQEKESERLCADARMIVKTKGM
jgi:hypothetical protein